MAADVKQKGGIALPERGIALPINKRREIIAH